MVGSMKHCMYMDDLLIMLCTLHTGSVTWSEVCSTCTNGLDLQEMENGHMKDSQTLCWIDMEMALMKGS